MGLEKELKKVVHWVEKHGAPRVLEALEGVVETGLEAVSVAVPPEFQGLAKIADSLAKNELEKLTKKLEHKLEGEAKPAE